MSGTETILRAIAMRRTVAFTYAGKPRTADPYILGYDGNGHLVLSAVQHSGGSGTGFRTFHIDKLSEIAISERHFFANHPDYNPLDPYIERVLGKV